jgi:uncharacterized protein YndB with AHSA1/START domain
MTQQSDTTRYGTLHAVDGRQVLRFERRLAHPVEKVWRAISEPSDLRRWFPADLVVKGAFEAGADIEFVFREGEWETLGGRIVELDPPRVFAYIWDADLLRFELRPDGRHTILTFTYTFDDRARAAGDAAGWEACLEALERVALGGALADGVQPEWAAMQDAYTERFGLANGAAERTSDGWTVRFERLLFAPVETVWAFLTAPVDSGADGEAEATPDGLARGGAPPLRFTNGYVSAGPLTLVEPPTSLEWELAGVPGGTRLVLTQTIPDALGEERFTALAAWHTHLDLLVRHLRGETPCWPEGRVEELRDRYAGRPAGATA